MAWKSVEGRGNGWRSHLQMVLLHEHGLLVLAFFLLLALDLADDVVVDLGHRRGDDKVPVSEGTGGTRAGRPLSGQDGLSVALEANVSRT